MSIKENGGHKLPPEIVSSIAAMPVQRRDPYNQRAMRLARATVSPDAQALLFTYFGYAVNGLRADRTSLQLSTGIAKSRIIPVQRELEESGFIRYDFRRKEIVIRWKNILSMYDEMMQGTAPADDQTESA